MLNENVKKLFKILIFVAVLNLVVVYNKFHKKLGLVWLFYVFVWSKLTICIDFRKDVEVYSLVLENLNKTEIENVDVSVIIFLTYFLIFLSFLSVCVVYKQKYIH